MTLKQSEPDSLTGQREPPPDVLSSDTHVVRHTQQDALTDLRLVLRLVEQKKIQVSEKTGRPSKACTLMLEEALTNNDFYKIRLKKNKWDQEIGAIKSFAWPLLVQASGLAIRQGRYLILSKTGIKLFVLPPAENIRLIWEKWLTSKFIDEFNRIDEIKGQYSKGGNLTPVVHRRKVVNRALADCEVNGWISVDEFFSFMKSDRYDFDITYDPWGLYIEDQEYGSLGYDGFHEWTFLQGRYVLCLLFEYAATLGMIDLVYSSPVGARDDFRYNWGTDELDYLSRYDGLQYFRVTPLGEYCLGNSDSFSPNETETEHRCSIAVMPSLRINFKNGKPSLDVLQLLDIWAIQESEDCWKLDRMKSINAIERGFDINLLETFLAKHDDQPLPEKVESFIDKCRKQGAALKLDGSVLLIDCFSKGLACELAEHKETRRLCQRAGETQLIIKSTDEKKFRRAINIIGYGMPL